MADILNMPERFIVPAGAKPSRFAGPLSEGLGKFAWDMGWVGTSDATGIVCEVPFTGNRPLIMHQMQQSVDSPDMTLETALVQIFTDQPHPEAGNGALVVMRLPVSPGADRAAAVANELNVAEMTGGIDVPPLLGAWCRDVMSEQSNGSHSAASCRTSLLCLDFWRTRSSIRRLGRGSQESNSTFSDPAAPQAE